MPKLGCICGKDINLSLIPNASGFYLLPESWKEPIVNEIKAIFRDMPEGLDRGLAVFKAVRSSSPEAPHIYECPHCGRLLVFEHESADVHPIAVYTRERVPHESGNVLFLKEVSGWRKP